MKRLNLKIEILKTGLNQKQFAEKININQRRLSEIVSGSYNPKIFEQRAIADGLNIKANDKELFAMSE